MFGDGVSWGWVVVVGMVWVGGSSFSVVSKCVCAIDTLTNLQDDETYCSFSGTSFLALWPSSKMRQLSGGWLGLGGGSEQGESQADPHSTNQHS